MASRNDSQNAGNTCCVCYKNVEYFSIGMCEHPVCYECSTRMRVLLQQNECPICRQDLPKVVFTKIIKPYRYLKKYDNLLDTRYHIYFESPEIQQKFYQILAHSCKICYQKQLFSSFNSLKDHMRKKHDLYYCDLCEENLKIFSHERRCYTSSELSSHRLKGDPDDRSHKGHPLCQFCEKHYMDNDELYRHLRRDHLFCHFCDADGLHHYYNTYDYLRDHFKREHFLCEEPGCAEEQFTSVFRTDIDLKAHKMNVHGRNLSKQAAKQARTLELEFTLAPRGDPRNRRQPGPFRSRENDQDPDPSFSAYEEPVFVRQPLVDVQSTQEFPTLGNAAPSVTTNLTQSKGRGNFTIRSALRPQSYKDNFPALSQESEAATSEPSKTKTLNFSVSSIKKPQSKPQVQTQVQTQAKTKPQANVSIRVNHRPNTNGTVTTRVQPTSSRSETDFPALRRADLNSASSSNADVMQWTKITCVKSLPQKSKPLQAERAASPIHSQPPPVNSGENFPSLAPSSKSKKTSSLSVTPKTPSWLETKKTESKLQNGETSQASTSNTKTKKSKKPLNVSDRSNAVNNNAPTDMMQSKPEKPKSPILSSSVLDQSNQRKRSELKINNLNNSNNINRKEDFPSLSRHPPGFSTKPPPGFSPMDRANGLIFTNSSGQNYAIVPEEPEIQYSRYIPPPNFQRRNKNILAQLNGCFTDAEESSQLRTFRYISGLYRGGNCSAQEYYESCRETMGASAFQSIFPELLALLPDIAKQQDLFAIYKREFKNLSGDNALKSCESCRQVLRSNDLVAHINEHTLQEFPSLQDIKAPNSQRNTAWQRN